MKKTFRIFSLGSMGITIFYLCLVPPVSAQSDPSKPSTSPWIADFQAAKKRAAAEKKDIALLFTASDWLDLAKTFDEKILSQPSFLNLASPQYMLVRLDFPENANQQSKQTTAQNQLLMRAYRVRGLPTLVLTDELGRPYAITGYHGGGLEAWLEEFNQLHQTREKRDRLFAEAKKTAGVERAQLLAQALPDLPGNIAARFYQNIMSEVIKLDPENQTGRVVYYQSLIADVQYADQMQKLAREGSDAKMLKLSDYYLKTGNLSKTSRQIVLFNKLSVYKKQRATELVTKTLLEIIKTDPSTSQGKEAAMLLKKNGPNSEKNN